MRTKYESQTYAHRKKLRDADPELDARYQHQKRNAELKKKYGITVDEYNKLFEEQDGKCALCDQQQPQGKRIKRLSVDHDHDSGRVRGLLCTVCNHLLGRIGDNAQGAKRLVAYLNEA